MVIIFQEDLKFKDKNISRIILGNGPFLADAYFGHRTRLYNMDLLRNPQNVANIIEKSYDLGVKSINLANNSSLIDAFKIAIGNGVEMQSVVTIGKTDMDYVHPNYDQARSEANLEEDINVLSAFDPSVILLDEFLVDNYDWDFIANALEAINDTGIPGGIITAFPFKTSEKLLDSPLIEDKNLFDFYMVPINKLAYMMDIPKFLSEEQDKLANLFKELDKKIIVNKSLAAGIQMPEDAFKFLNHLDYVDMLAVGIASEIEAEKTFTALKKL